MYKDNYNDVIVSIDYNNNTVTFLINGTRTFVKAEQTALQKQLIAQMYAVAVGDDLSFTVSK